MIALQIDFAAGQFHANPWDRRASGAETEWPPSPWQLLQAVVAAWHRRGEPDRDTLLRLLDTLAEPPQFVLPIASSGSTRHARRPRFNDREPARTLMLDSFIALEPNSEHCAHAFAIWPNVSLADDEREALRACCAAVRDLGTVESSCELSVVTDVAPSEGHYPVDLALRDSNRGPIVRRLAAGPSLRGITLLHRLSHPAGAIRHGRYPTPVGAAWVDYRMPLDFGWAPEQAHEWDVRRPVFPPTLLRFALDAERAVLPPITDAVTIAERMRQAAIKRHSAASGTPASKRLSGKQSDGTGRREGHDHPFFLPLDMRGRGIVDGLDVWFPAGCTHNEFCALSGVTAIWDNVVLEGTFPVTFLGCVEPATGTEWATATPVVLDRFPKYRGAGRSIVVDAPEEQLRRALADRGLPPARVEVWNRRRAILHGLDGQTRPDQFRRARAGERAVHPVVGATIRFDRPVTGPIVLGRLAHFGLGRFDPLPLPG